MISPFGYLCGDMYSVNHVSRISLWFQIELAKRNLFKVWLKEGMCSLFSKVTDMEGVWATSMLPHFSCSGSSSSKLPALLTAPRPPPEAWLQTLRSNSC